MISESPQESINFLEQLALIGGEQGLGNPYFLILLDASGCTFEWSDEIGGFLSDSTICNAIRYAIAERLNPISWSCRNVQDFFRLQDLPWHMYSYIAKKLSDVSWDDEQTRDFLRDTTIFWEVRHIVTLRLADVSYDDNDVQDFLQDNSIHYNIRKAFVGKISDASWRHATIQKLLEDNSGDANTRIDFIHRLSDVSWGDSHVRDFLRNNAIDHMTRGILSSRITDISWQDPDVLNFIKDESVHWSIRKEFISQIQGIVWDDSVMSFLSDSRLDHMYIRGSVAEKLENIPWSHDVQEFLLDTTIPIALRFIVVQKIGPIVGNNEVKFFLQNTNVGYQIWYVLWEKLCGSFLPHTDLAQVFLANKSVDFSRYAENLEGFTTPYSFDEILLGKKQYEKAVRMQNVQEINVKQAQLLGTEITPPQKRTLVFYYRQRQGAFSPHYHFIIALLQKYIQNGHSKVFTDFRVNLRWKKEGENFGNTPVSASSGDDFRSETTVFSDTIHLNHGTVEDTPGSMPIVAQAILTDISKCPKSETDFVPLDLLYFGGTNTDIVQFHTQHGGLGFPDLSSYKIAKKVLQAVDECENRLLSMTGISQDFTEVIDGIGKRVVSLI